MKTHFLSAFMLILLLLTLNCKKENTTLPIISTNSISILASSSAISGGIISNDGEDSITARGVCWSISQNPTISHNNTSDGKGAGSFTSKITGLTGSTKYYLRAYAIINNAAVYGNEISFTTTEQVIDYNGNIYNTVQIGTQLWMQENLSVRHYRNGDQIENSNRWGELTTGACCDYEHIELISTISGKLYNFYAVSDPRGICPTGWHIPSKAEWWTLVNYLGGDSIAGGKLKEEGRIHWGFPNTGATNESGFTGLPGGCRSPDGSFNDIGSAGYWHCSTEKSPTLASTWGLDHYSGFISTSGYYYKQSGWSVRCIKDQ